MTIYYIENNWEIPIILWLYIYLYCFYTKTTIYNFSDASQALIRMVWCFFWQPDDTWRKQSIYMNEICMLRKGWLYWIIVFLFFGWSSTFSIYENIRIIQVNPIQSKSSNNSILDGWYVFSIRTKYHQILWKNTNI